MTFQNLDSNFEKKAATDSQQNKNISPEEAHQKQSQPVEEKEKYESKMSESLKGGLLSVFQKQLSKVRTEKKPDDSFDTINITSDDIVKSSPTTAPSKEVSEEQINSLLEKPQNNKTSIEEELSKAENIEIVTEKTQVKKKQEKTETNISTDRVRYEDNNPVTEKRAKLEDAVSQIAVLRAANGEATTLGTDGKQMYDDEISYHHQQHKLKKQQAKQEGKSSAETVLNYEEQPVKEENIDPSTPHESELDESDIF